MITARDSVLILIGRLFWMMAGPFCLLLCAVLILNRPGSGWLTGVDVLYWLAVAGMILGRFSEYWGGDPRNAMGEPATTAELRRYVALVAIVGPTLWVAANIVSNHLL
jgi:hypothetical protein